MRHIVNSQSSDSAPDKLAEPIEALVLFQPSQPRNIRPVRFRWRGKVYRIVEITAHWQSKVGYSRLRHFTARDSSSNYYQLSYNSERALWSLTGVWDE